MFNCLAIFVIIGIAVTVGFVLAMIMKGQKSRTVCHLEISNLGNVRSRYDLKAEDTAAALKFQFMFGGAALPQRQIVEAKEMGSASPSPVTQPGQAALAPGGSGGAGVFSFAGAVGDLLYTVGYILPSSVGEPVIRASSRLREGKYAAERVGRARDQAARLTSSAPGREARRATPPAAVPPASTARTWVQTPFVEPGETMTVDLYIDPLRFHTQPMSYPFKVMSRSVELPEAPWATDEWTVKVDSLSSLSRNTPLLIGLGVVIIALILSAAFCVNSTGILR